MASTAQFITLEQFERVYGAEKPYYEYWFGEALQKSMPTSLHGSTQILLGTLLMSRQWRVASEVKLKISAFANPVPDLIADPRPLESPYPTKPFSLCVEILSPDDDLRAVFQKSAHYLDWGIQTAWIIDPVGRSAYCMTQREPKPAQLFISDCLTAEPDLTLPLREFFDQLDRISA